MVLDLHEGSKLSDYWQRFLCRIHVASRKTFYTPTRPPVDLALLATGRETHMSFLTVSLTSIDFSVCQVLGKESRERHVSLLKGVHTRVRSPIII